MAQTYSADQLDRMFAAFDRVRELTAEHPDVIARGIIKAAALQGRSVEELVTAAMDHLPTVMNQEKQGVLGPERWGNERQIRGRTPKA